MSHYITNAATNDNAGSAREHEAVVQQELTNLGGTATVETNAGQIGRIGRQEEVTVCSGDEGQDDNRLNANGESQRNNYGDCSTLRVNQLRGEECNHSVSPGVSLNGGTEEGLQHTHVSAEEGISHPGNAVYGYESDNTGGEYLSLTYFLCLDIAEEEHNSGSNQHDHLDNIGHGNRLHYTLSVLEVREKLREGTEYSDESDSYEEDVHATEVGSRQNNILEALVVAIYISLLLRISDKSLELRILIQIHAAVQADETAGDNAGESSNDGNGENLGNRNLAAAGSKEAYQRYNCNGSWGSNDTHLGSNGGSSHRALRTDILLDSDIIDNREHGVYYMAGTAKNGEEPGSNRSKYGDVARISTQKTLSVLKHYGKTAASLQETTTGDNCKNGKHNAYRGRTRLIMEAEHIDDQTDGTDDSQTDTTVTNADNEAGQQDQETYY